MGLRAPYTNPLPYRCTEIYIKLHTYCVHAYDRPLSSKLASLATTFVACSTQTSHAGAIQMLTHPGVVCAELPSTVDEFQDVQQFFVSGWKCRLRDF